MLLDQKEASDQRHMTPQQLSERLGIPLSSIYGWRGRHKGPRAMRIGKHVRYRVADVLDWEQTQMDQDAA